MYFQGIRLSIHMSRKLIQQIYTWKDSIVNGRLITRYYPKHQGFLKRTEIHNYNQNGKIEKTIIKNKYPNGVVLKDSTIYNYIDSFVYEVTKYRKNWRPFKERYRTVNDTTIIEQIMDDKIGLVIREFKDEDGNKHNQVIEPELSDIVNMFKYDKYGNEIEIDRYEKGEFVDNSLTVECQYDDQGRIIVKDTYYGDGMELGHKEIIIYR